MPNNWFQFKQFLIKQEGSAMKVGTDSVILGSWVSLEGVARALDVGTGSGILVLMLAQRMKGEVEAVEIVESAYKQAVVNVQESPWNNRIRILHASFQDFSLIADRKYDLIVSNPPYFHNSHKAGRSERSLARHSDELPWEELVECSVALLNPGGRLAVIIPAEAYAYLSKLVLKQGLKPRRILRITPKPGTAVKRIAVEFGFLPEEVREEELIIEITGRHQYSREYIELTKEFYLF